MKKPHYATTMTFTETPTQDLLKKELDESAITGLKDLASQIFAQALASRAISNKMFSGPGTYVIEFVWSKKRPLHYRLIVNKM